MATNSSVVKDFLNELNSLGMELDARRRFQDDVVAFLRDRNLVGDFNVYRARLHAPKPSEPGIERIEDDGEG